MDRGCVSPQETMSTYIQETASKAQLTRELLSSCNAKEAKRLADECALLACARTCDTNSGSSGGMVGARGCGGGSGREPIYSCRIQGLSKLRTEARESRASL